MSRDIEPLLAPWMERQARGAPYDLLPRVMKEVQSMPQESRTFGAGPLSFSMVGWLTGGIAVVATAIAAGVLVANLNGVPAGGLATPSPTATASSTAGTIRANDPVGDVTGNAPDILAVSNSRVTDDLFRLEIELAEPMAPGTELSVGLETNGAGPYPGPIPMEGPELCNGWFMEEFVSVGPTGSVQHHQGTWQPSPVLSGTKITLDIPLEELGVTDKLAFQVMTTNASETGDWFPNETDGCYPLIWEDSPAEAPSSSSPTAAPSSATGTVRRSDPVGDATGNAPDIVAVSTRIIPEDEVTLVIELAEAIAPGTHVSVYLETNGIGPYSGDGSPIPLDDPQWCSTFLMEESVLVGPAGYASDFGDDWDPGPNVVDGTTLTLSIPYQPVLRDGFLTLFVHTAGSGEGEPWSDEKGQDRFPDDDNTCLPVIVPES